MKNIFYLLSCCLIFSSITSCSSEPEKVNACELCVEKYKKEIVTTEGIVVLPQSFYTTGGSVTLFLKDNCSTKSPSISIKSYGEKKNTIEKLADGYKEEDVKIYDNEGHIVKLGDRIRVTGKLVGASNEWCEINVDKIELLK